MSKVYIVSAVYDTERELVGAFRSEASGQSCIDKFTKLHADAYAEFEVRRPKHSLAEYESLSDWQKEKVVDEDMALADAISLSVGLPSSIWVHVRSIEWEIDFIEFLDCDEVSAT